MVIVTDGNGHLVIMVDLCRNYSPIVITLHEALYYHWGQQCHRVGDNIAIWLGTTVSLHGDLLHGD